MANDLNLNDSTPVGGLGTFNYTVTTAGFYTLSVQSTIPHSTGEGLRSDQVSTQASALTITIEQNGGTVVAIGGSALNPTPTQPTMGAVAKISAAVNDVLGVVLSSPNAIDNQLNSIKSIVNLYTGE